MRKITALIFVLILALAMPINASIIASARGQAVVNIDVNEGGTQVVDRNILVKNVNQIPVDVALAAGGDIEGRTEIQEASFILQPGEEKNVRCLIKISQPGTYNGRINVGFAPGDGSKENGVGVSLKITIIADGEGTKFVSSGDEETDGTTESTCGDGVCDDDEDSSSCIEDCPEETNEETDNTDGEGVNVIGGGQNPVTPATEINIPLISFLVLLGIIIILGVVYFIRGGKK
ncbi:MAG: hypothetical protein PHG05_02445 [Candidatus Nanoarchaeia archaeon]|nr:hypothetical protein [Candidatus Nanoarchaeia archaeon]